MSTDAPPAKKLCPSSTMATEITPIGPLRVKKMSAAATLPARGSAQAAGYDLSRYYCGLGQHYNDSSGMAMMTRPPRVL